MRKPPKVSRGCGGVARARLVHVDPRGPGRLTLAAENGVGGVGSVSQGCPGSGPGPDPARGRLGERPEGDFVKQTNTNFSANGKTQGF